jgi:serine protease
MVMLRMRRAVTAAAMATLLAGASAEGAEDGPAKTGRALISVRTPPLPVGDGRRAAAERERRLDDSSELLRTVAARNGIRLDARSDAAGMLATDLDGLTVTELRTRLADDPLVESVRAEPRAEYRYTPNEPYFMAPDPHAPPGATLQWHLLHQNFPAAWDMSKGIGAEVAVIDSGVDVTHPDIAGRLTGALNCAGPVCAGADVSDTFGHGTHVAGLACADTDNGYGLASAGFDCSIYAIKTDLSYLSIINSIYAAANHGSDAINMSFGGSAPDTDMRNAIDYAWARGAIPVAAADNQPNPPVTYPAHYVQAEGTGPTLDAGKGVVVTSVGFYGLRSAFAQQTNGVSIAAVGSVSDLRSCEGLQQGLISTWPAAPTTIDTDCTAQSPPVPVRTAVGGDDRFAYLVGTSMASPQAAGLVALMRSADQSLAAAKAVRLLKLTASNCGKYAGGIGWGVIRADRAVAAALGKELDPPSSRVRSAKRAARGAAVTAARRGRVITLRLKRSDPTCSKELEPSGVRTVNVFASANGGRYRRVAKSKKKKKVRFRAKRGRRYRFYSIAVDKDGNREAPPEKADAKRKG